MDHLSMQMKEKLIQKQHLDVIVGFVPLIDVFHNFDCGRI
jgi:hypothetical protein